MRILIVEDESLQRRALAQTVEGVVPEADVIQAADGLEAVMQCRKVAPDVVFLDIRMPKMDGIEAARKIKEAAPDAALFFLTAYEHFAYAREAVGLGIEEYLLKPVAPEDLARCIDLARKKVQAKLEGARREAEMRKMLSDAMPLLLSQFVRDLCLGSITSQAEYRRRASVFDLRGEPDVAVSMGLGRHSGARPLADPAPAAAATEAELELRRRAATNAVEGVLSRYPGSVLVGRIAHDELVALVGTRELRASGRRPGQILRRLIAEAADTCRESELEFVVGIGTTSAGVLSIWQSYAAAARARERAWLIRDPGHRVMSAEDLGDVSDQWAQYPLLAERGLAEAVRSGLTDDAEQYLAQLADYFVQSGAHANHRQVSSAAQSRALECLAVLARAASEGGGPADQVHDLSAQAMGQALRANTPDALATSVSGLAEALARLVEQSHNARQSGLAERAAAYLEGHFPEEISLTGIAEELHVSPFYLSHVFHQAMEITFSEYLTNIRINEAKRLLTTSDLPVAEIASRVGYREPNYFGRVFKKATGVTPLAWRRERATRYD